MKKLLILLIAFVALPLCTLAAPQTLDYWVRGDSESLLTIKKPEVLQTTHNNKKFTISAIAGTDVRVSVYRLQNGCYTLIRDEETGNYSGLFAATIELVPGNNAILVYAQNGTGNTQTVRLDVNFLQTSFMDSIKGFASSFQTVFSNWLQ